jgi:hypothetical protein
MTRSVIFAVVLLSSAAAAMRLDPLAISAMIEDRRAGAVEPLEDFLRHRQHQQHEPDRSEIPALPQDAIWPVDHVAPSLPPVRFVGMR